MASTDPVTLWIAQVKEGQPCAAQELLERYFHRLVHLARARLRGVPGLSAYDEDVALSAFKSLCLGAERGRYPRLLDRDGLWRLLAVLTIRKALRSSRLKLWDPASKRLLTFSEAKATHRRNAVAARPAPSVT